MTYFFLKNTKKTWRRYCRLIRFSSRNRKLSPSIQQEIRLEDLKGNQIDLVTPSGEVKDCNELKT